MSEAQDVILEKTERGDKVVILADNTSLNYQLVTLDMTLEHVISDKQLPLEVILKPEEKKVILVLSPTPLQAWSYKTKYSFEEYHPELDHGGAQVASTFVATEIDHTDIGKGSAPNKSSMHTLIRRPDYHKLPPGNTDDEPMPAMYARKMHKG